MYLSDRQRVEICLPAQMMLAGFIAGIPEEDQQKPDFLTVRQDLLTASSEPVDDLPRNKRDKVLNRVFRLHHEITQQLAQGDPDNIPKIALVEFHLIRFIIEDGYLQYVEDGAFDRSINAFMEALQHHAEEERFNASAMKQAKKMLRHLQQQGYYRSVEPPD